MWFWICAEIKTAPKEKAKFIRWYRKMRQIAPPLTLKAWIYKVREELKQAERCSDPHLAAVSLRKAHKLLTLALEASLREAYHLRHNTVHSSEEQLRLHVLDELEGDEAAYVEEHLLICGTCIDIAMGLKTAENGAKARPTRPASVPAILSNTLTWSTNYCPN